MLSYTCVLSDHHAAKEASNDPEWTKEEQDALKKIASGEVGYYLWNNTGYRRYEVDGLVFLFHDSTEGINIGIAS